jgi:RNA polymerase sigma-70 factor (ECF subfamily)
MSDQFIQRWLNDSDERAAEALYQTHHKRVYRLAYALLGDAGDAEEVMQDTMVYALTRVKSFDPQRASFTTWLHTITVSRCRDRQRRKRPAYVPLDGHIESADHLENVVAGPEQATIARESRHELWNALDQLSPNLREAVVLRYWSGHTYQEMAEILHCPLPTAQSRVRLAYDQLRRLLDSAGVPALGGETLQ